jgi:hypothetical protein
MVSINNEHRLSDAQEVVKFREWLEEHPWVVLEDAQTLARLRAEAASGVQS